MLWRSYYGPCIRVRRFDDIFHHKTATAKAAYETIDRMNGLRHVILAEGRTAFGWFGRPPTDARNSNVVTVAGRLLVPLQ